MNTRTILDKLKSRKLWVTIIGIIIGVAMAFGVDGSEYADIAGTVAGAITALGAIVAYISGEAKIDAAASVPINLTFGELSSGDGSEESDGGEEAVDR